MTITALSTKHPNCMHVGKERGARQVRGCVLREGAEVGAYFSAEKLGKIYKEAKVKVF